MTSETIETILYKAVKADPVLGLIPEIKKGDLKPVTKDTVKEGISIFSGSSDNQSWQHSFAYVHVYVPDVTFDGSLIKDSERIGVLESAARSLFGTRKIETIDGKTMHYMLESLTKEKEEARWSHVVTVKLRVTNENFLK